MAFPLGGISVIFVYQDSISRMFVSSWEIYLGLYTLNAEPLAHRGEAMYISMIDF